MERVKFEFHTPDGQEYMLWAWKGDYVNLGAGAEMGIYTRGSDLYLDLTSAIGFRPDNDHWIVDMNLRMPMTMSLNLREKILFGLLGCDDINIIDYAPEENQWWITGFNPSYKYKNAQNMSAAYTIDFSEHRYLYDAFITSRDYLSYKNMWTIDEDNKYLMTLNF